MAKEEKTPEMGVSKAGQFTIEQVPDLLQQVNDKIKALKGDKERATKVSESLGVFGKISEITEPGKLIDAYSFITRKAAAYKEFVPVFQEMDPLTKLGEFKESGHSLKVWQEEITAQYREVTFQTQLDKLEKAKAILTENLSRDQKFNASMADLKDLFA